MSASERDWLEGLRPEDRVVTEQPNVETQAWKEQVERVREALQSGRTAFVSDRPSFKGGKLPVFDQADAAIDALTAQIEEMEPAPFEYRKVFETYEEMMSFLAQLAGPRLRSAERDLASSQQAALLLHKRVEELVTHGRHCPCSACAREDWTRSDLAPCGIHGSSCPPVYAPFTAPQPPLARDPEWPAQEC